MSGGGSNGESNGHNGGLHEMVVESVRVHMLSSQHVVILRDANNDRYLPIWIGPWEANAIAMRLQGVTPERPMTHDLFSQALAELGVTVTKIIVSDLSEDTFRARLMLQMDGRELDLDARPSDAIALAVRTGVPIFATDSVLDRAGVMPEGAEEEKLSVFREFVNSLNVDLPDDPESPGTGRETRLLD
jgi:bifunctional DNase/RNase